MTDKQIEDLKETLKRINQMKGVAETFKDTEKTIKTIERGFIGLFIILLFVFCVIIVKGCWL